MYTSYFGLQENPFSLTPDERFFYSNPVYEEAYARLQYGIQERKGLIVLTGEVGCGKTLLLRHLTHTLASQVRFISLDNPFLTFEALIDILCTELAATISDAGMAQQFQQLKTALIDRFQHNELVALIIDEAHSLSFEVLEKIRLLSNLETGREKLLQIVLVGQPELEEKLDQHQLRQLKQRVVVQYQLGRLTAAEVKTYINHRLRIADYEGRELFSAQAVARINAYAHGIPRLINTICDNALLSAYAYSLQTITPAIIDDVASELRLKKVKEPPASFQIRKPDTLTGTLVSRFLSWAGVLAGFLLIASIGWAVSIWNGGVETGEAARNNTLSLSMKPEPASVPVSPQQETRPVASPARLDRPQESQELTVKIQASIAEEPSWKTQPIRVRAGQLVWDILLKFYGNTGAFTLDVVKEFNPHIGNLNHVRVGQKLWLPPLSQETLLQPQPNGSFRLPLAAFYGYADAETFMATLRAQGFQVAIVRQRVSDDVTLYRVQAEGLKDRTEAEQAWAFALLP